MCTRINYHNEYLYCNISDNIGEIAELYESPEDFITEKTPEIKDECFKRGYSKNETEAVISHYEIAANNYDGKWGGEPDVMSYAEDNGLEIKPITGALNGYPEPYEGEAVFGFETFEDAEKAAYELGGKICLIHWRDGWHFCNNQGRVYEPIDLRSVDFGDNYRTFAEVPENFMLEFFGYENEAEVLKYEDEDRLNEILSECEALKFAFEQYDFENGIVIYEGLREYNRLQVKSMGYSEDTHNYAIAVVVNN